MIQGIDKEIIKSLTYPLFLLMIVYMLVLVLNYKILPELSKFSDIDSIYSMGQYILNDIKGSNL